MGAEELFEEVNELDQPSGQLLTKRELHERKIPHRVAAVFVFTPQGELYVQEHLGSNRKLDHTVGGHVDPGESYKAAAYREMTEEISLSGVELEEIVLSYQSDEGEYKHVFGIFTCIAPDGWTFKPNEEVDAIYPMKLEDIVQLMNTYGTDRFVSGFINTMKKYLEMTGSELRVNGLRHS